MAKDRKIDRVILGLLSHGDLTGYEIKKQIDEGIRFFWKGSFGSIYPALSGMEEAGQVVRLPDDSTGGREKIRYRITERGRAALRDWLRDEQFSNDLKYETLLKLYFGGAEGRDVSIRNIELFERQVSSDLQILKWYKSNLERALEDRDHVHYYLTVTFGIDTYETYLKWCAKAKKLLAEKG